MGNAHLSPTSISLAPSGKTRPWKKHEKPKPVAEVTMSKRRQDEEEEQEERERERRRRCNISIHPCRKHHVGVLTNLFRMRSRWKEPPPEVPTALIFDILSFAGFPATFRFVVWPTMETRTGRGTQHVAHHAGYSYKPLLAAGEPFRSRKSEREIQAEKKSLHLCPFFPANLRCLRPKPDVQSVAHITERKIGAKPVNAPKSAAQVVVIVAAFRNFLAKPLLVGIFSEHRSTSTQLFLRTLLITP